jgi:sugar lactone lactonase YvrE
MNSFGLRCYSIRICAAVGLLAGCGGPQPPIGAPGVMPQTPAFATHAESEASKAARSQSPTYLYVANGAIPRVGGNRIDIFLRDDPTKGVVDSIRKGINEPDGIFIDASGVLYVANTACVAHGSKGCHTKVTVYARGGHEPLRAYTGASCARDVVAGSDGTVYVADSCGGPKTEGRVLVYAPGKTKPSRMFYPGGGPYCLTLDAENNLYVGYNSGHHYIGQVKRYHPGAKEGEKLLPDDTVYFITGIVLDDRGALLVANGPGGVIDVFTAKGKPPSRKIKTGQSRPFMFALDKRENEIYVTYPWVSGGAQESSTCSGCGKKPNTVVALDYPSGKRLWTLREPAWVPMGVTVSPSAPF